jgi:hypothetical protein
MARKETSMSRTIILTDDQYEVLARAGEASDKTPERVLAEWIEVVRANSLFAAPRVSRIYSKRHVEDDPNVTHPSADHLQGSSRRH